MKYLIFLVLPVLMFYYSGCNDSTVQPVSESPLSFTVPVWDYSEYHYMFDTGYKKSFLEYFNSNRNIYSSDVVNNTIQINEPSFEVWVQEDPAITPDGRYATAWITLPERGAGYNDTLKGKNIYGKAYTGYFRKLAPAEYIMYSVAGFISLKVNVQHGYHIGVTYRTFDNKHYGTPSSSEFITPADTLILKMIKTANPDPELTPEAWQLIMKNIYRIPAGNILQAGFNAYVIHYENFVQSYNLPNDFYSLSKRLGIDRYSGTERLEPYDGVFDFLPGYTIVPETGDIIFPTLQPFYDEIIAAGYPGYVFYEIYSKRKIEARDGPNSRRYFLQGSFYSEEE